MAKSTETVKTTVKQVQRGIRDMLDAREYVCIPNVSWGFFPNIECDLIAIGRSNRMHEYEIKRSWADFLADFKKPNFHDDVRICNLTFVLPKRHADEFLKMFCQRHYKTFRRPFDFLFYEDDGSIVAKERIAVVNQWGGCGTKLDFPEVYRTETYLTKAMRETMARNDRDAKYRRPLFLEEQVKLFRLGLIKVWEGIRTDEAAGVRAELFKASVALSKLRTELLCAPLRVVASDGTAEDIGRDVTGDVRFEAAAGKDGWSEGYRIVDGDGHAMDPQTVVQVLNDVLRMRREILDEGGRDGASETETERSEERYGQGG